MEGAAKTLPVDDPRRREGGRQGRAESCGRESWGWFEARLASLNLARPEKRQRAVPDYCGCLRANCLAS